MDTVERKLFHIADILAVVQPVMTCLKERPAMPDGTVPEKRNKPMKGVSDLVEYMTGQKNIGDLKLLASAKPAREKLLAEFPFLQEITAPRIDVTLDMQSISSMEKPPFYQEMQQVLDKLWEHHPELQEQFGSAEKFLVEAANEELNSGWGANKYTHQVIQIASGDKFKNAHQARDNKEFSAFYNKFQDFRQALHDHVNALSDKIMTDFIKDIEERYGAWHEVSPIPARSGVIDVQQGELTARYKIGTKQSPLGIANSGTPSKLPE
jgi:hypothetical protein